MNFSWHVRSLESIHNGALTNSKRPECFIIPFYPTHVKKGKDCFVYDVDGAKFTDFICALGTNLLGYANPYLAQVAKDQIDEGTLFSFGSTLEVEAAEKLKDIFPFVSKVRFLKTGTEAAMGALRIAMAHTGRKKVLSKDYHGWADAFISLTPPANGVPEQPHMEELKSLSQITEEVAAVIIEPIVTQLNPERIQYLVNLQEKCRKTGTLLIFDEIITGFRFPKFSFSNYSGIHPDIILLGKAVGGGFPLSVIATKPGIGDGSEWFVSSTFAGDLVALRCMMKTIELLNGKFRLDHIWRDANEFSDEFNSITKREGVNLTIEGYGTRGVFVGDDLTKALFFQEAARARILFGSSFFYNFHHTEIKKTILSTCTNIFIKIKLGQVKLEGSMPKKPYAQQIREKQEDANTNRSA